MKDYEENGYLEAALIVDEAIGDLISESWPKDKLPEGYLEGYWCLLGVRNYLEDQIPRYLRKLLYA